MVLLLGKSNDCKWCDFSACISSQWAKQQNSSDVKKFFCLSFNWNPSGRPLGSDNKELENYINQVL